MVGSSGAVTPTYVLPGGAITGGAGDGSAVTFNLGNVKNVAVNGTNQLIVVEFNALVDNVAGNVATHALNNTFKVDVAGSQSGSTSNTITTTVVEPKLTLTKTVLDQTDNSTTTGDAGDQVQYTYTLKNTGGATAFNVNLADLLPADLAGSTGSLTVSVTGGMATGQNTAGTNGNTLSVLFASLASGATVTVKYTATIQNTVTPLETLDSTASATWTSLPGTNGTTGNPTGSNTPGAPGSATGERTAPVTPAYAPDNYIVSKDAPLTVLAPPSIQKVVASTSLPQTTGSNVAVGEQVTYDVTFTLSEATYTTLSLTDALPAGLTYVSSDVVSIGGEISGSALVAGSGGTVSGSNVVFNFGNGVVDNADNLSGPQHQIVVEVVAAVADTVGNTNGTVLTNGATLDYGGRNAVGDGARYRRRAAAASREDGQQDAGGRGRTDHLHGDGGQQLTDRPGVQRGL